jgi:hypothetical protein
VDAFEGLGDASTLFDRNLISIGAFSSILCDSLSSREFLLTESSSLSVG